VDGNAETIEGQVLDFLDLTTTIVSAYVSKNSVRPGDMPDLLASVHAALTGLGQGAPTEAPTPQKLTPAQIRKSITPDALISFIDGKPYKTLKRHLTGNGLTIEQYRERYGLPWDYPSTAASYSAQRSELARSFGLGQQRRNAPPEAVEPAKPAAETSKKAGRPRKAKNTAEA
jgi:predicted transcriptional regulator